MQPNDIMTDKDKKVQKLYEGMLTGKVDEEIETVMQSILINAAKDWVEECKNAGDKLLKVIKKFKNADKLKNGMKSNNYGLHNFQNVMIKFAKNYKE